MLVSRFYGIGILGAIAQKAFVQYLIENEANIIRRNPVDILMNVFGAVLNQHHPNDPLNPQNSQSIDHLLPYLSFGAAFFCPQLTIASAILHSLLKLGELQTKANIRNPIVRQNRLKNISIMKIVIAGALIALLIIPASTTQVKAIKVK